MHVGDTKNVQYLNAKYTESGALRTFLFFVRACRSRHFRLEKGTAPAGRMVVGFSSISGQVLRIWWHGCFHEVNDIYVLRNVTDREKFAIFLYSTAIATESLDRLLFLSTRSLDLPIKSSDKKLSCFGGKQASTFLFFFHFFLCFVLKRSSAYTGWSGNKVELLCARAPARWSRSGELGASRFAPLTGGRVTLPLIDVLLSMLDAVTARWQNTRRARPSGAKTSV